MFKAEDKCYPPSIGSAATGYEAYATFKISASNSNAIFEAGKLQPTAFQALIIIKV